MKRIKIMMTSLGNEFIGVIVFLYHKTYRGKLGCLACDTTWVVCLRLPTTSINQS
jgi:hypothetical protein